MIADAPIRCSECAQRTHAEWLSTIKADDVVLVRNGALHFRGTVERTTATLVLIGTLKFRRSDGWQVKNPARLKLRLVRSHEDLR